MEDHQYKDVLIAEHAKAEAEFLVRVTTLIKHLEQYKEYIEGCRDDNGEEFTLSEAGQIVDDIVEIIEAELLIKLV